MKTVPGLLVEKQELINKAMIDYELLEEFWYSIGQDDFNAKYVVQYNFTHSNFSIKRVLVPEGVGKSV